MKKRVYTKEGGYMVVTVLVFGFIGVILIGGLVQWAGVNTKSARVLATREAAFQAAEAGVEYYRWHLAHDPTDYQDGTGGPGPYVHNYFDKEGTQIGTFSLDITPPATGTTIVTIRSTGAMLVDPTQDRTVETRLAIPSLAQYAVVANAEMRFGAGTEVFGQIHANGGIRFDGLAHNIVTSAQTQYDDDDSDACTVTSWGVHTCLSPSDPSPPTPWNTRPDVFEAGRQVSVPAVDFDSFAGDFAQIRIDAQADGHYFGPSGVFGYNIVLKTDDTFDLYSVDAMVTPPSGCYNILGENDWDTWSIANETLIGTYAFPSNGLIFVEDHLWVEGQIDGARLTIVSGVFPETPATDTNIMVNEDLLYTNYDGTDVIALMAQRNISAGMESEDDLRVDAALVAKNGRVGRHYYRPPWWIFNRCAPYHDRDTITLFGMIATRERYGFAWTDGNGYDTRNITYDGNLLYGPPPSFPLVGSEYEIISWKEIF